jgi:hypothetical protein
MNEGPSTFRSTWKREAIPCHGRVTSHAQLALCPSPLMSPVLFGPTHACGITLEPFDKGTLRNRLFALPQSWLSRTYDQHGARPGCGNSANDLILARLTARLSAREHGDSADDGIKCAYILTVTANYFRRTFEDGALVALTEASRATTNAMLLARQPVFHGSLLSILINGYSLWDLRAGGTILRDLPACACHREYLRALVCCAIARRWGEEEHQPF